MQWSRPKTFGVVPPGLAQHSAVEVDGVIFFLGGSLTAESSPHNDVLTLDTETLVWNQPKVTGVGPSGRIGLSCVGIDDRIFAFGGTDGQQYYQDLFILNTKTMEWLQQKTVGQGPGPRKCASANVVGGKIVFFGGSNGNALSDTFFLDIETYQWTAPQCKGQVPEPRLFHAGLVAGGKLAYFGGSDARICFPDMEVFDTASGAWVHRQMQSSKCRAGHTINRLGRLAVIFGGLNSDEWVNDLDFLNLGTFGWEKVHTWGQEPSPRGLHTSILVDSRLFVYGGTDGSAVFNELYILDLGCYAHLVLEDVEL